IIGTYYLSYWVFKPKIPFGKRPCNHHSIRFCKAAFLISQNKRNFKNLKKATISHRNIFFIKTPILILKKHIHLDVMQARIISYIIKFFRQKRPKATAGSRKLLALIVQVKLRLYAVYIAIALHIGIVAHLTLQV